MFLWEESRNTYHLLGRCSHQSCALLRVPERQREWDFYKKLKERKLPSNGRYPSDVYLLCHYLIELCSHLHKQRFVKILLCKKYYYVCHYQSHIIWQQWLHYHRLYELVRCDSARRKKMLLVKSLLKKLITFRSRWITGRSMECKYLMPCATPCATCVISLGENLPPSLRRW